MEFNADTFKALGSKTRLSLIKHLSRRRMTLSELSKCTGLHVSSVKEHLDLLEGAGIVVRHDEGYKWKYYSLTPAARRSFSNPVEINLVLPAGVLLMLSGFAVHLYDTFFGSFFVSRSAMFSDSAMIKGVAEGIVAAENVMTTSPVFADVETASVLSGVPLLSLVLVLLGVFLVGIFIGLKIRENRIGS
ncbi:helix-turn-helix domain-containing protein [archaeon]|nr:helix-turn-helix domain-containing protein [archaeon]